MKIWYVNKKTNLNLFYLLLNFCEVLDLLHNLLGKPVFIGYVKNKATA